ncbi:MAG TPA: hypothetical protein VI299_09605 [Polyangiales bacterium]
MTNRQAETPSPKKDEASEAHAKQDAQLDETVWESFPASDPGGSWAGRDIPPDERKN